MEVTILDTKEPVDCQIDITPDTPPTAETIHATDKMVRIGGLTPKAISHPDEATQVFEKVLAGISAQLGATFTFQLEHRPGGGAHHQETTAVTMHRSGPDRDANGFAEFVQLLEGPPHPWQLEIVDADLEEPESPAASHTLELVRRLEPAIRSTSGRPAGFGDEPAEENRALWRLMPFGPGNRTLTPLIDMLQRQQSPVVISTRITPTVLEDDEREWVLAAVAEGENQVASGMSRSADIEQLTGFLNASPLFEVSVQIQSPEPLPSALVSVLGWTVSGAATLAGGHQGGFELVDPNAPEQRQDLASDRVLRDHGPTPPRLRRLFDMAGTVPAILVPISSGPVVPGFSTSPIPSLRPPLAQLPKAGIRLGQLTGKERGQPVYLDDAERMQHMYVVGKTGTAKTTFTVNLALQDIHSGRGLAYIDPHGDAIEAILEGIPEERFEDVIVVDPSDPEAVVGINILEAESEIERSFIVAELCNLMYTLYDRNHTGIVGPRFESWMRNGALLLLENPQRPSSFLDIPLPYTNTKVQKHLLAGTDDPGATEFWLGEIARTSEYHKSEVLGWFRSKWEPFRTTAPVRRVVGQAKSSISFSQILSEGRILLINLSKGRLGEYNSNLLGIIVMAKLWAAALQRASMPPEERRPFTVFVDEFQNLGSDAIPDMLAEARKFGLGFVLANQYLRQIPEETREAILGNVSTRVVFRVGPRDAYDLPDWLGDEVKPSMLKKLPNYHALVSLSSRGMPLDPVVVATDPPGPGDWNRVQKIKALSRERWARPVAEIDAEIKTRWADIDGSTPAPPVEAAPVEGLAPFPNFFATDSPNRTPGWFEVLVCPVAPTSTIQRILRQHGGMSLLAAHNQTLALSRSVATFEKRSEAEKLSGALKAAGSNARVVEIDDDE